MEKQLLRWRHSFLPAMLVYMVGAVVLFLPFRERLSGWDLLLPVNAVTGALGVWFFSRRWIGSPLGRLVAGAVYGFGPLMFYFIRFHPFTGTLAAVIPWSFCPAALVPARWTNRRRLRSILSVVLLTLPFAVVVLFSALAALTRHFVVPLYGAELTRREIVGIFFPCAWVPAGRSLLGFYHLALVPLLIGTGMMLKAKRWTIPLLIVTAAILACTPPLWQVSPILWLILPHTLGALLVGMGSEGIVVAGRADRRWLLMGLMVFTLLAVVGGALGQPVVTERLGLATERSTLFLESAKLYALGMLALVAVLITVQLQRRMIWLRTCILGGALAVDIYLSGRFVLGYTI